jgi:hypothetical protein
MREVGLMAEKRRSKRIPVYLRTKEVNQSPTDASNLLDICASGAKIETTTLYRPGDSIKFSCLASGTSLRDLGVPRREDTIWQVPTSLLKEEPVRGRVIWVLPHPDRANYFLVGLKFSTKLNWLQRIFALIIILIFVRIGVEIATIGPNGLYGYILEILEWCLSPLKAVLP